MFKKNTPSQTKLTNMYNQLLRHFATAVTNWQMLPQITDNRKSRVAGQIRGQGGVHLLRQQFRRGGEHQSHPGDHGTLISPCPTSSAGRRCRQGGQLPVYP